MVRRGLLEVAMTTAENLTTASRTFPENLFRFSEKILADFLTAEFLSDISDSISYVHG